MASQLFSPFVLRELQFKNRVVVSPMCQYSAVDGIPTDWHLVHLGSFAKGGSGLVFCEATSVSPEGRISPGDTGIWNQRQMEAWSKITKFIVEQEAVPGIQIAHAGRKASTPAPWEKSSNVLTPEMGGWVPLAPSEIAFDENSLMPRAMTATDLEIVRNQFVQGAKNALVAGFQVLEIHMAHGYLLNEFLSPLSNFRTDPYGGEIENRMRFPLEVAKNIRDLWPQRWPVFVRLSVTDWVDGGWSEQDSILFSKRLKEIGIDLIDCSSGGLSPKAKIPVEPGYQVPLSRNLRKAVRIPTGAVGMITEAHQAEEILKSESADLIFLGRELLRDPHWPLRAAHTLHTDIPWPNQYRRAKT